VSIYLLLVRPFNVMRFLFGMKPKKREENQAVTAFPQVVAAESRRKVL